MARPKLTSQQQAAAVFIGCCTAAGAVLGAVVAYVRSPR